MHNKEYRNQLILLLESSEPHETRDYLIYKCISYAITAYNYNLAKDLLKQYKDIINYDNRLLLHETITMINHAIKNYNTSNIIQALTRLHILIAKEHNPDIHMQNNLITRTLIKHGHNQYCTERLLKIINNYKDSFAQQNIQAMDSLLHQAQSTYNRIIGNLVAQSPDAHLNPEQQNCKKMYIKVTTMYILYHIDKNPHTSLIPHLQQHHLFLETIYEILQHAITLQYVDHAKDILHHISSMTLTSHKITDIASKLTNTLKEAETNSKEDKQCLDHLQIKKYIYHALISLHVSHRNKEQIKLLLNENVIDINYNDGSILKRFIPNDPKNNPNNSDYAFLKWLVKECGLDIHASNNFLLHAMISKEQISMIKYILEEGWETFVLNKEDDTLNKLYEEMNHPLVIEENKYNNPTYQYLEVRPQPISNMLFEQAINMAIQHKNISYLIDLINLQKKRYSSEDKFYEQFNKCLMGLVKSDILITIFARDVDTNFRESPLNDLILYNTKTNNASNVKDIAQYIYNIQVLEECINICLADTENKDYDIIYDMIRSRIKTIEYLLSSQQNIESDNKLFMRVRKLINTLPPTLDNYREQTQNNVQSITKSDNIGISYN